MPWLFPFHGCGVVVVVVVVAAAAAVAVAVGVVVAVGVAAVVVVGGGGGSALLLLRDISHTKVFGSGPVGPHSVLDKCVPGYYLRRSHWD